MAVVGLSVAVGTVPVMLAAASTKGTYAGPVAAFTLTNGSTAVYLGGTAVSASAGAQVASAATFTSWLFGGDVVYGATASGSSTVQVFRAGG